MRVSYPTFLTFLCDRLLNCTRDLIINFPLFLFPSLPACMGVNPKDVMCYNAGIHGASTVKLQAVDEGLTSAQVGGIAGGVSAAVILLAAAGAFFVIRRRRAAKAAKAQAALPTYSSQDEKNAMQQVVSA